MNILILDDSDHRLTMFRAKLPDDRIWHARTPRDAIAMLRSNQIHVLCLDHDLGIVGSGAFEPSGDGTGYEVAEWLAQHPSHMPNQVILHSLNDGGRARMKRLIPEAVEVPFLWEKL